MEDFKNTLYVESFLRGYSGNKFKLMDQILPHFPVKCNNFVDMFTGSGAVNYNYTGADHYFCNELDSRVLGLHEKFYNTPLREIIQTLESVEESTLINGEYNFRKLKDIYNETRDPLILVLIARQSFGMLLSFNSKGECNVSENTTKRKSKKLTPDLVHDINVIKKRIEKQDRKYVNGSFVKFDVSFLQPGDFVYLDPPYFETFANYNKDWGDSVYGILIERMQYFIDNGIHFGYSDMMVQNDMINGRLHALVQKNKDKLKMYKIKSDYTTSINNKTRIDVSNSKRLEIYLTNYTGS